MPKAPATSPSGLAQLQDGQKRILVIDFGSQVTHLICRRVREAGVYCELRSCLVKLEEVTAFAPTGIILSGGPHSVYDKESPHLDKAIWAHVEQKQLPVLGICYGLQEICHSLGGKVEAGTKREFGHAEISVRKDVKLQGASSAKKARVRSVLFKDIGDVVPVWMSHGDKVTKLPEGFVSISYTSNTEYAAVEHHDRHIYGVQFHPEVTHTPSGAQLIKNFVNDICGCPAVWNMSDFAANQVEDRRAHV